MKNKIFSIIGGDKRSVFAANRLAQSGYLVRAFGFDHTADFLPEVYCPATLCDALSAAGFVLLPLPTSPDGKHLSTTLGTEPILLSEVSELLTSSHIVFGGKLPNEMINTLELKNVSVYDYAEREEFAVLNAISTAEGAIEIAMRELPVTLNGTKCLVIGFGRIGKVLCRYLSALGAQVTAAARKPKDFSWMQACGYTPLHTNSLQEHIGKFRVIFNTVPHLLLDETVLQNVCRNSLMIDLASKPGGTDFHAAKKLNLQAIHALSLPGKSSPETAGNVICETIFNILSEQEVK